jgi:hypothetical protein
MPRLLLASLLTAIAASAGPPLTGIFQGTGRACYGTLSVKAGTISWITPFSQCRKTQYEVIEQREDGNRREAAFHLKQRSKGCLFEVLYLFHPDTPDPKIDWHVIGYGSLEDYQSGKQNGYKADSPRSQSCWLTAR